MVTLTAAEKIIRAKSRLGRPDGGMPFFAYLVMHLKQVETDTVPLAGVDMQGNLYYNPAGIDKLSEEQIQGLLAHEIMHVVLNHLERTGGRIARLYNCANDITVNDILVTSNLQLPRPGLIPENHVFKEKDMVIADIDKKTSEEIYDEMYKYYKQHKMIKTIKVGMSGQGDGDGESSCDGIGELEKKRFDEHKYADSDGKNKKPDEEKGTGKSTGGKSGNINIPKLTEQEKQELKDKWKKALVEAAIYSKQRGLLPAGLERLVDGLLDSKIDWRQKLYKYLSSGIIVDFTWCVDKNTLVSTPKGEIPISGLKKGQTIYGYDGKQIVPTKVLSVFKDILKPRKYIIYTQSGDRIICSEDHKFYVDGKYIKAKDLSIGHSLLHVKTD